MDVEQSKQQSMEKFKTELDSAITRFNMEFEQFKESVTEEMRILHKQKARDRSDLVIQYYFILLIIGADAWEVY